MLKKHDHSLQKFIKMENFSVLLTINDPVRVITAGYDEGKKIAMWTSHGKRLIDAEKFQEIVKTFNVEFVECAYDGATAQNCPKKRLSKATDRTKVFVDKCFSEETAATTTTIPNVKFISLKLERRIIFLIFSRIFSCH